MYTITVSHTDTEHTYHEADFDNAYKLYKAVVGFARGNSTALSVRLTDEHDRTVAYTSFNR